ncbi:MAG: ATP-binding cassette domain-containing protein [Deltaproteobacteria bacterium]|nr:MAG: ATP-binding cassette domain-containing protein [Deltaproteobacteria bacterium]
MIRAEKLTKRYRDLVAVDALTFEVPEGAVLGFLGPNGAGKSSTMRMLTGALPPTEGRAVVAGYDVFEAPLEVKRRVGYLPEHPPLYEDLSVAAYLRFVAALKGLPRSRRRTEAERVAERAGVAHVLRRRIGNLSKGYRQRVGIAQALIGAPPVLILDEPTVGLDPGQIREVRELIRSLGGEHTVVLSTHILAEVAMVCQRVLIIHRGKKVADDSLEALKRRHEEAAGRTMSLEEIFLELIRE